MLFFFFFKQKTAYEMRISDWSSDVCSSDLADVDAGARDAEPEEDKQEVALDFRLLRYFVAVAEELHLARAAERLGIEQSPVSRAMRDLESQLGVQLFDRSTRLTRLTWAGQVFLGECRRVMAPETGRASCRESGVQDVSISGVCGYLKKK